MRSDQEVAQRLGLLWKQGVGSSNLPGQTTFPQVTVLGRGRVTYILGSDRDNIGLWIFRDP